MRAMILAAGYGTRLRPITYTLPKPLVPVCNRPLIGWVVDSLLRAGIRELIVNLHHLPEAIERFLRDTFGGEANFHFSFEPEILGTGGGVRKVRSLLEREKEFFLVNGDTIQFPPYELLLQARRARDSLAALTLRHVPENDEFTPVWLESGLITGFGEGRGEELMFSGSHLISSRIFHYLPDRDFSGIIDEVYVPLLTSQQETIAGVIDNRIWFDIGTARRYLAASRGLADRIISGEVKLPPSSRIEWDSIIDDGARTTGVIAGSTIGRRSIVEGAVRGSVVWNDCFIASGVRLDSCVVAHGVAIRQPQNLANVVICRDDPAVPHDAGHRREDGLVVAGL